MSEREEGRERERERERVRGKGNGGKEKRMGQSGREGGCVLFDQYS